LFCSSTDGYKPRLGDELPTRGTFVRSGFENANQEKSGSGCRYVFLTFFQPFLRLF